MIFFSWTSLVFLSILFTKFPGRFSDMLNLCTASEPSGQSVAHSRCTLLLPGHCLESQIKACLRFTLAILSGILKMATRALQRIKIPIGRNASARCSEFLTLQKLEAASLSFFIAKAAVSPEERLISDLLENYTKEARPVKDPNNTIVVVFGFELVQLVNVVGKHYQIKSFVIQKRDKTVVQWMAYRSKREVAHHTRLNFKCSHGSRMEWACFPKQRLVG